jgi:hypothetical protein
MLSKLQTGDPRYLCVLMVTTLARTESHLCCVRGRVGDWVRIVAVTVAEQVDHHLRCGFEGQLEPAA